MRMIRRKMTRRRMNRMISSGMGRMINRGITRRDSEGGV